MLELHLLANESVSAFALITQGGLLLLLVVCSGIFSGSETVLFSLTPAQLEHDRLSSNPFRRIAPALMDAPKRTLMVILIGNTAVNVLLFANSYVLFNRLAAEVGPWVTPVSGVFSVLLVVVCGEVVPKVLAVAMADRFAPVSATIVNAVSYVFIPLGTLLDVLVIEPLTRLLFGKPSHAADEDRLSAADLKILLEMSRRRGLITKVEDVYLREVIDLSYVRVRDMMVPRVEVQAFDVNEAPEALRSLMRETRLTKVPVFESHIDNIIGLVYAKVLFFERDKTLRELVQPVRFVPEAITGEQLLKHFRKTKSQIAIAVDEFGGMAGLVTLEDVLEEIVGDIFDPEDAGAAPEISSVSETEYEISGQLSVHYWMETFGIDETPGRVTTVGGLVNAQLGRPAEVGDVARFGNVELSVVSVQRRRIRRLKLRLIENNAADPALDNRAVAPGGDA